MKYCQPVPQTREDIVKCIAKGRKVDKVTLYHFVRFSNEFYSFIRKQERKRKAFEASVNLWEVRLAKGDIHD